MKIIFNETTDLQLVHPITREPMLDTKKKPMTVVIVGTQTSTYKNARDKIVRAAKGKANNKDIKNLSLSEMEDKAIDMLVPCILEFKNLHVEYEDGKFLDSKDIKSVLVNAFWIKEQIDEAIADRENFIQPA